MSICIEGIEMPKDESEVLILAIKSNGSIFPVRIDGEGQPMIFPNEEMKNHAVPVPPHGRCVDADALIKKCEEMADKEDGNQLDALVLLRWFLEQNAPTIIPASEEEMK